MRPATTLICSVLLPLCLTGRGSAEPSVSAEPATQFEQFSQAPTAQNALQLAQDSLADPSKLRTGLILSERHSRLLAWALYHYPIPALRRDLEPMLKSPDQVAAYWAAKALGRIADAASIPALAQQFPKEENEFWEVNSGGPDARRRMYYFRDEQRPGEPARRVAVDAPPEMPNIRVAYAALEALGRIGGPQAEKILMRQVERDHYLIRQGAVLGLGELRSVSAGETLGNMAAADPVLIVRMAAKQALARIEGRARPRASSEPDLPPAIVFIKTTERTESNLGYRDSYPYPILPWYAWGQNLYVLTPPQPDGELRNLTNLTNGGVQGAELSYDATKVLFAMRKDFKTDGFHVYEINLDGSGLRQLTAGNCNDVDPYYLPDGKIVFCSDRAGYREFYHQERSRVLYTMNADGSQIRQISFNPNSDFEPIVLDDGRVLYASYRFYGWDGGPPAVPEDPRKGISRIETILRTVFPDGTQDQLFYGSMRGGFYSTLRPMPYANQYQTTAWPRTDQMMGVSVSFPRVLPDGRLICVTPAGLTIVDPSADPMDCEIPLYPEVLNLAGGEEVYIHSFDDQNPIGRLTAPYPIGGDWVLVSHAPWYDTRPSGYGIYLLNLKTRQMRLVYDDPQMSDVDAVAVTPRRRPTTLAVSQKRPKSDTGYVFCGSVFNSDLPFERSKVVAVRVLEAVQVGMSLNGNLGFQTRLLGTVPIAEDGSFHVEVPADTPLRFALVDVDGNTLVHETEFNYVRPNERKSCVGCHEPKGTTPMETIGEAATRPPYRAVRKAGDPVYGGTIDRSYNYIIRE